LQRFDQTVTIESRLGREEDRYLLLNTTTATAAIIMMTITIAASVSVETGSPPLLVELLDAELDKDVAIDEDEVVIEAVDAEDGDDETVDVLVDVAEPTGTIFTSW